MFILQWTQIQIENAYVEWNVRIWKIDFENQKKKKLKRWYCVN